VGIALTEYGKLHLPKTPAGKQLKTDDEAMKEAAPDGHPLVDAVLEYRSAAKMISTYIDPVLDCRTRCIDGRMHPTYSTMLVATFRLSSEDPNIQNWPSRNVEQKKLRGQVKAPKGHMLVKFDYKALEARVIAMASNDRALCESIIKKIDIHGKWRDKALEIYPDYYYRLEEIAGTTDKKEVLKGGRNIIKTDFVFASFFGSLPDACAKRTGMPLQYMQELSTEFWGEFPGVKAWIKQRRIEYKDTGSSRLLTGAVRHAVMPGNEPINTPIQGSGAIIVVEAMRALGELSRRLKEPYLHPRINIHDDLTFILPDDETMPEYIDVIVAELLKVRFDWQTVPLAVEGAVGLSWESLEEFGDFVGDYIR
jgi:DNA polymerase-1